MIKDFINYIRLMTIQFIKVNHIMRIEDNITKLPLGLYINQKVIRELAGQNLNDWTEWKSTSLFESSESEDEEECC